ncbi:MAG: hypothetical protein QCH35_04150 [Methanomicrobiaceae archaeon]|nr:hypothetical protein [Methanomicrobiaceae archaeon]
MLQNTCSPLCTSHIPGTFVSYAGILVIIGRDIALADYIEKFCAGA